LRSDAAFAHRGEFGLTLGRCGSSLPLTGVFMSRTLLAALTASALVLSAWPATAATSTVRIEAVGTVAPASNPSPLPPGRAAGIKEAQGIEGSYWLEAGLVIGAFIVIFVLLGIDDSDEAIATTGT